MTQRLGKVLGQILPAGNILLLEGDLGTGKTSLIQGLGKGLGISDAIVSPTFTLINEYHDGRVPLYHLDLYRLTPQQVDELYLETYWQGVEVPPGIVAIEWSERLLHRPSSYLFIKLNHKKGARQATLQTVGSVHNLGLEQVPLALRSTSA
ncbi:tRNA (adenosine(37)-N6)-threonylcarbamoyltransferase complex ATPase subunit type 1 TsaE [Acaryochloris sp. 'Moss Beach']|uniref:tRNA (adenosine(37)-N6)-threonylcarbamoyltransferase complex ATPase subunit type 1 TsaE n=1 Tax=Acaryochloris sp. 'Moss Beach' TaxID=2740837 RepID=UPI001F0104FC|nr:tRNA (adenosine(37)-N6)-threonylcarbamoyltransferase complex ATPase subunit type 1 TsaE [Acaryochloris sp. 'Moss Beach']UJB71804.1 tRNA (adenosine(37)-N6)-threonylcarbamoyltransferase complex ATPase subunit type 1 TsaE [Acaryochloris sp. 'Moss Beach']